MAVILALLALPVLALVGLLGWSIDIVIWMKDKFVQRRERKRDQIEAELDRTQARLHATILQLATELHGDAQDARKAMIQASFETSRQSDESSAR